jgi:hypothetical protein
MVLQIDSGDNPAGVWVHPDSPERLAQLISHSADLAGANQLTTNDQSIDSLVTSLPWSYMVWSGQEVTDPEAENNSLRLYGETLSLTLITLLREEQSWVAEPEAIPEPVFIPPTPTPGGTAVDGAEPEEVTAVGLVTFTEPSLETPFEPGEFFIARFTIIGGDGAYLAGQAYQNLRLRVSVRSAVDESMLTFNQPGGGSNNGDYSTWITIPDDAEAGEYFIEITAISTSYHGNPLELVGDLHLPLTVTTANTE